MSEKVEEELLEPQSQEDYRDYARAQVNHFERDLTKVLFGDESVVLTSNGSDPLFGKLAMVMNVVLNSGRNAAREKDLLLKRLVLQQEQVSAQNVRLDAILAATDDGMIHVRRDGTIDYANPFIKPLIGLSWEQIKGISLEDFSNYMFRSELVPADVFLRIAARLKEGSTTAIDETISIESPASRMLRLKVQPVRSPGLSGYLIVLRDITVVEEALRAKNDLLGNLAHEVRTPLTSIKGFIDLLRQGKVGALEDPQKEVLETVANNVSRLTDLVRNMLDADRIRAMPTEEEATSIADVVRQVLDVERNRAEKMGLELRANLDHDSVVRIDRSSLVQVIHNLLSNAIKYTRRGHIQLSLKREDDIMAILEVADTGIGIRPEGKIG